MGALMRSLDWSSTALGAVADWPQSLRTATSIMLHSLHPMFIAWGRELVFLYNDGYRSILGAKHPAALGRPFTEVWAEIWPDILPLVQRALAGGATWSEDLRLFMERSGYLEEVYFTFSYSPISDESGGVGGMFCACTETTGKVVGDRRLRCLRRLAAVGADAKTLEAAYASCLRVLEAHAADIPFALLYRLGDDGPAELIGSANVPAGTPAAPQRLARAGGVWPLDLVLRGEAETVDDLEARLKDVPRSIWDDPVRTAVVLPVSDRGQSRPGAALVLGANPRRAPVESYRAFLQLVANTIATAAANARAFEQERRRAESLAELDRAKTTFFGNVSHEFRTPLALMLGPLEDMLGDRQTPLAQPHRQALALVHRNGLRLLKLVNTLLDFSRIEAGRTQATYVETDLPGLTAELASNFRSACERAGLGLVVDCPPLAEPVYVDRDMWEKIVLNLVSNAFKFTFEGEIAVAVRSGGGSAQLTVSDTGVGIPPTEQPHIFERFRRVEATRGRSHEGTGIGLALVRELVKLHGGTVTVDSTVGGGTTFTVSIPLGREHLPAERISIARTGIPTAIGAGAFVEEALRWLPGGYEDTGDLRVEALDTDFPPLSAIGGADARRARILWADDNADMRAYVERLLGRQYDVQAVPDGQAALAAARADPPDLVLADVMMPRLDGLGLLRALRDDDATRAIPIILLSARAGEDARIAGLTAGADDYLTKPFAARELIARVEAQLNMLRIRREADAALRESEARFRHMADNAPVMVRVTEPDGACTFLSQSWYDATGQTPSTGLGFGWLDAVHPDDRAQARRTFLAANEKREAFQLEYRFRSSDGDYHWAIDSARPRLGGGGEFLGYIGSAIEIDERKRLEEHRKLLIDELNHRVRNTLAIVASIAAQTRRHSESMDDFSTAFEGRIQALAATHTLLAESRWGTSRLDTVIDQQVRPYAQRPDAVAQSGPALELPPKTALALSLVFHELVTNAAKYGALANASGQVAVGWTLDGDADTRVLRVRWVESGGPPVAPPTRTGFGSKLIDLNIAHEFRGHVDRTFRPEGLECRLTIPLRADASA
ncbi:MAG: response regulator [Rhodospirillaceae bacterium]|nr:response regulator [Rhodospirillaceae bacterium]